MLNKINERIAAAYGVEVKSEVENILWEVFYTKKDQVTTDCLKIVSWYETSVAPPLSQIMDQRRILATKSVFLATMVGQAGKVFRGTHVRSKLKQYERAITIAEETAVSKAQMISYVDNAELRTREAEAESAHELGRLILNQINKVLDAMNQEIADLRNEQKQIQ